MNKLNSQPLDCPFCGLQLSTNSHDPDFCYPVTRISVNGKQVWRAGCIESDGGCGAEVTGWSAEEAIKLWNKRSK